MNVFGWRPPVQPCPRNRTTGTGPDVTIGPCTSRIPTSNGEGWTKGEGRRLGALGVIRGDFGTFASIDVGPLG